jgi:hypothetical protein
MRHRNLAILGAFLLLGVLTQPADAQVRRIGIDRREPFAGGRSVGSYLEFPRTPADRQAARDPRHAIAERYPSREVYLRQHEAAAQRLVQLRYLLPGDAAALVLTAGRRQYW